MEPAIPPVPPPAVPLASIAMKWSYFKPEFSGKTEEDPEAQILRTIDWIDAHSFSASQRVQRFPLTLAGEARLWYLPIPLFQGDLEELQEIFRI